MNGSYIDRNIYDWEPPEPEFVNERERGWILCWCKILNNSAIWILRKFRLFNVIQKTWWPAWWPNLTNRGLSCYICRTKVADCEQSWTPRPNFFTTSKLWQQLPPQENWPRFMSAQRIWTRKTRPCSTEYIPARLTHSFRRYFRSKWPSGWKRRRPLAHGWRIRRITTSYMPNLRK